MVTLHTRRQLLQASLATAAFGPFALAAQKSAPPSETLNVGVIGVFNRGYDNLVDVARAGARVVALCDIDEERAARARKEFPAATFDVDFRRLLDRKGLDAVLVATPDHTHAPITAEALRRSLHVYCEKPLTHTVFEARTVAQLAAKHRRVTQMGTQIHASANYRRVVEAVQSGVIGPVGEVHVWCARSYGGAKRPTDQPAVPPSIHWDLWLGPAPSRPYHPAYHPFHWRKYWAFGGGTLNDMACHFMDLPFWALKLRSPTKVSAEGSPPDAEAVADWVRVNYQFPARGELPPVKLTWYDGGKQPEQLTQLGLSKSWGNGVLFVGKRGMLLADYGRRKLLPEKDFEGYKEPMPTIPASIGHHKEWVEACKTGGPTTCSFDYSGPLTETVLLGTVAYRSGRSFTLNTTDGTKVTTSDRAADVFLHKEYRKGWSL